MFYLTTRKIHKDGHKYRWREYYCFRDEGRKNFVLSINYLTSQYFTFVLVLYNSMLFFFYCSLNRFYIDCFIAHIFELATQKMRTNAYYSLYSCINRLLLIAYSNYNKIPTIRFINIHIQTSRICVYRGTPHFLQKLFPCNKWNIPSLFMVS